MNVGFALCGSFCTFSKVFPVMKLLSRDYPVTPIFSDSAYSTDTRFGSAKDHIDLAAEMRTTSHRKRWLTKGKRSSKHFRAG